MPRVLADYPSLAVFLGGLFIVAWSTSSSAVSPVSPQWTRPTVWFCRTHTLLMGIVLPLSPVLAIGELSLGMFLEREDRWEARTETPVRDAGGGVLRIRRKTSGRQQGTGAGKGGEQQNYKETLLRKGWCLGRAAHGGSTIPKSVCWVVKILFSSLFSFLSYLSWETILLLNINSDKNYLFYNKLSPHFIILSLFQ